TVAAAVALNARPRQRTGQERTEVQEATLEAGAVAHDGGEQGQPVSIFWQEQREQYESMLEDQQTLELLTLLLPDAVAWLPWERSCLQRCCVAMS
ncbi:unnamed protein product, partial [Symbiodinium microadriaticum]